MCVWYTLFFSAPFLLRFIRDRESKRLTAFVLLAWETKQDKKKKRRKEKQSKTIRHRSVYLGRRGLLKRDTWFLDSVSEILDSTELKCIRESLLCVYGLYQSAILNITWAQFHCTRTKESWTCQEGNSRHPNGLRVRFKLTPIISHSSRHEYCHSSAF